jgi:putative redox protein
MVTKQATVTWLTGMSFDAQMGEHHILVDTHPPSGNDRGPSPMELLLASLAACTAMDVVSILTKGRQPFTGLVVRVEGERAEDHPHRYTRCTLVYEVHGTGVDLKAVERAVALSEEKYCSVSATFKQAAEIVTRIELHDAAPSV